MNIYNEVAALDDKIIAHGRWLYKHPEIGFDLPSTQNYLLCQLKKYNLD